MRGRWYLAGAALFSLLLAAVPVQAETPAPRVVILLVPFTGPSEAPDSLLGEGLMDLLAWGLGRTFGLRVTEPQAAVSALTARQALN